MTVIKIANQTAFNAALGSINLQPQYGFTNLGQAVNTLIAVAFFFGGLAAFFYLLLGALKYIVAGSDDTKVKGARDTMIHAIVGLIMLGLVMVVFQILVSIIPGLDQYFILG